MIRNRIKKGEKWIYFFSALKDSADKTKFNTTDLLLEIAAACTEKNAGRAVGLFLKLENFHIATIKAEFAWDKWMTGLVTNECKQIFHYYRKILVAYFCTDNPVPKESNDYVITARKKSFSILWLWEIIAYRLYDAILRSDGSKFLDTSNIISNESVNPTLEAANNIRDRVEEILRESDTKVIIAPWYTWVFSGGIIKSWGRWYSDATAANIYRSLKNSWKYNNLEFAIKKLFPICSADPRIVWTNSVRVIRSLSLGLLLEMIGSRWAGWQFVNRNAAPTSLFTNSWAMRIYSDSDQDGSLVTMDGNIDSSGILFIQSKPAIVIRIESFCMHKIWYVEKIGEFFNKHNISIDNIVSSQTIITLTLNDKNMGDTKIDEILVWLEEELTKFEDGDDVDSTLYITCKKLSEIYIGWENFDYPWLLKKITTTLADANINIDTGKQPSDPRVVIIWVDRHRTKEVVKLLHRELIECK